MKNQYQDIRSVKNWLKKLEAIGSKNDKVTFFTLSSLTPDKIADAIRGHYYDLDDPKLQGWIKEHYTEHSHPITQRDADDKRLIAIILFIINHILESKYFARKSYDKGIQAVSVSSAILRKLYDDGSYIRHVVDVALAAFILEMATERDTAKKQARKFKIHSAHLLQEGNSVELVECPDQSVAKNIRKNREKSDTLPYRLKEVRKDNVRMMSLFYGYHLRADYDASIAILKLHRDNELAQLRTKRPSKYDRNAETEESVNLRFFSSLLALKRMCSDNIHDKILTPDKNGRLHSNLSSFPSILRKHLSFIGCNEPMAMIDMANTQPLLVLNLVMERFSQESGKKIDTRQKLGKYCRINGFQDVMRYVNIVENGAFYKDCFRLLKGNKKLKDITPDWKAKVREMIYTSVFFGDGTTKWKAAIKLRERFGEEYPTIYRIINEYRIPDTDNLSNRLQQEESKLFIDDILTKLIVREKHPHILSLHDGIYCPASAIGAVISKFEHAFAKSEFQVKLKVDHYATGETSTIIINELKS